MDYFKKVQAVLVLHQKYKIMIEFFLIASVTIVPFVGIILSGFVVKHILDLFTKPEIESTDE